MGLLADGFGNSCGAPHLPRSPFLPPRSPLPTSPKGEEPKPHRAASANAPCCICQRTALHPPTHYAASANAPRCIRQRTALHLPTHRTAFWNVCDWPYENREPRAAIGRILRVVECKPTVARGSSYREVPSQVPPRERMYGHIRTLLYTHVPSPLGGGWEGARRRSG